MGINLGSFGSWTWDHLGFGPGVIWELTWDHLGVGPGIIRDLDLGSFGNWTWDNLGIGPGIIGPDVSSDMTARVLFKNVSIVCGSGQKPD